jgi:hypothetical protein
VITTGNLTFSGTAQRITGDFSNATVANRLMLQSGTTDGITVIRAIPNGTGQYAEIGVGNNSDATAATSTFFMSLSATEARIASSQANTGTLLPLTFQVGGSERARIDTTGRVGIGTNNPSVLLMVTNTSGENFRLTNTTGSERVHFSARYAASASRIEANNSDLQLFTKDPNAVVIGTTDVARVTVDSSGNVGIGGTADATDKVTVAGNLPVSSAISISFANRGVITSATTGAARGFQSFPSTAAASFALNDLAHFWAGQNTLGAGSSVTNQYGFFVHNSVTGATNNYGFYSDIASGSNRWNFYAAGTAQNYFAGNTGVGTTPDSARRLDVKGSGTTGATVGLSVRNSSDTFILICEDDGYLRSPSTYNLTSGSAANVFIDSNGRFFRSTSSLRYKSDVTNAAHGLAEVLKLRSVTYKGHGANDGDTVFGGLIAEEVHDAGLTEFVAYDKEGRPDAIHYGNMVALLVKAVQELTARVAELEAK